MIHRILRYIKNIVKFLNNKSRLTILRRRGAKIGENVVIEKNCNIDNPKLLSIESNVYIGKDFYANCTGELLIEKGTIISNKCTIMTYNHDYKDELVQPYGLDYVVKPVTIKQNVWVGINVNVCPGVTIGEGSVIGMGTTVSKDIPPYVIYAGDRIIKNRPQKKTRLSLLEIRSIYNPINYLKFSCLISSILRKNNSVRFSDIIKVYSKPDWMSLAYTFASYHDLRFDLANESIYK